MQAQGQRLNSGIKGDTFAPISARSSLIDSSGVPGPEWRVSYGCPVKNTSSRQHQCDRGKCDARVRWDFGKVTGGGTGGIICSFLRWTTNGCTSRNTSPPQGSYVCRKTRKKMSSRHLQDSRPWRHVCWRDLCWCLFVWFSVITW